MNGEQLAEPRLSGHSCVVLADANGAIVWESTSTDDVFSRPAGAGDDVAVRDVLGAAVDDLDRNETDTTTISVSDGAGRTLTVDVTAEPVPTDAATTAYDCRVVDEELDAQTVLSRVTDGVIAFDTEWRYTYVNERAADLVGESPDALLGERIWDVFPEASDSRLRTELETAMETQETVSFEWYGPHSEAWFDIRVYPSSTGVSMYFEDITERKERERALANQRDLVEQILRVNPMGVCVHDTDKTFVRVNERAEAILGTPSDDLVGETLDEPMYDARTADGSPFPYEAFPLNRVLETGELELGAEMSIRRPDGSRVWVSVSAAPVVVDGAIERVVVAFDDISERKRFEADLRERERQFRGVFDGTLDALVLADDAGEYVAVNDAACELYGVDESELLGMSAGDFAAGEFDVDAAWAQFLEDGSMRGEFPLERPDGEVRITDFVATANVVPGQHLSALRDITERKRAEEELAAQRDELDRLNHVNELIRDVNRAVVGATDRESVEAAVCRILASASQYGAAMTLRVTAADQIQVEHVAGTTSDVVERLQSPFDDGVQTAIERSIEEVRPTVLGDLQSNDAYDQRIRDAAESCGVRTALNVPIAYDDVIHGVLMVGAVDADAFEAEERDVFAELGQILGTAIDAIQTKKLLHANAFQELDLAVSNGAVPMTALQERVGGTWTLEGVVPVDAHEFLLYFDGRDVDADALSSAGRDVPGVGAVRIVATEDDRTIFEVRVEGESLVRSLVDAGGWIRDGTIMDGRAQFVVDVTPATDVRGYLSKLERSGVGVDLLAKREVDRTTSATPFGPETQNGLTDRQRTVLEAAYYSGYFEWPRRRTTGEELAASLDISSSTLHQHLRVALGKVLEHYLDAASIHST
jgi:PAS domain S-box-containing protein